MKREVLTGAVLVICAYFLTAWTGLPPDGGQRLSPPAAQAGPILESQPDFGRIPVNFIPNRGQLDEKVAFYIQGRDKTIYFGSEGVTFALPAEGGRWALKLDFVDSNPAVRPAGADETGTIISYFKGGPGRSQTGLAPVSRIIYANLWPGIDLAYSGTKDRLKYEFIVHPGADPSRIRLAYRGANSIRIGEKGNLIVDSPSGGFEDGAPAAYQNLAAGRVGVPMAYEIKTGGEYGFSVGAFDSTQPLILDPVILIYCGYVGGSSFDYSYGIAVDGAGCPYIAGYTASLGDFPFVAGPDRTYNGGSVDAFVAKLNSAGTALEYCGYIGGAGNDYVYSVAVDPFGSAYVAGYTTSTEATFPVLNGPDLTQNGLTDAFVAKVNPKGTALEYCGYIGGASQDYGKGIAVDGYGRAFVTGSTFSSPATFPFAAGPDLVYRGGQDAFVARVAASGKGLDYCGYIGGSGEDIGTGIAVNAAGEAAIVGQTNSPPTGSAAFPVFIGPDLSYRGGIDAFVAQVNAIGSDLMFCGYVGGTGDDYGTAIALDSRGDAYLTGYTSSTESGFPLLVGPTSTHRGGIYDAFVAKVNLGGATLAYLGYIGGADYDAGTGIAVDPRGYAFVTGYTSSSADSFPVKDGPGLAAGGSFDAFVARVGISGMELGFCGYIGGSESDMGTGIALGPPASGYFYLTGNTYSSQTTFPVIVGPDLIHNGSRDGFAAKLAETSITLLSPDGGEIWTVGFRKDIIWHSDGMVGNIRIEYSIDGGKNWGLVVDSTENDGRCTWIVPDEVSEQALIRVSEADDGAPSDTSRGLFVISNDPILVVTSPNGGEIWKVGSVQQITWLSGGDVGNVTIEYTADNGVTWIEIAAETENDGSYDWIVPDTVSSECRVRILEGIDFIPADASDELFSIVGATVRPEVISITPRVIKTIRVPAPKGRGGRP